MLLSHESRLFEHSLQIDLLQKQVKSLMDEIIAIKGEKSTFGLLDLFSKELLSDTPSTSVAWQEFHKWLASSYDQFAESLGKYIKGEQLIHLLTLLQIIVARNAFKDETTKRKLFESAQEYGVHVLPVSFYSPVPNTKEIPPEIWEHRYDRTPAFQFNAQAQLSLLDRLSKWAPEMVDTPQNSNSEYSWSSSYFPPLDAIIYYSIIREFKPRMIIEVGGGDSTMVAVKAALRNGFTRVKCIEPYPREILLQDIPIMELITKPVQQIPFSEFEALEPNDILFYDGTHVSKCGSDVNYIVLDVLPRLKPGVLIHIHDILLPWDYSKWCIMEMQWFWNEIYLVLAFLLFNDSFEVLIANHYLANEYRSHLRRTFPWAPSVGGGSLWLQRRK
jgi:hypothetical protein